MANTSSTTKPPVVMAAMDGPSTVTTGRIALRNWCLRKIRLAGRPLARAVRRKSALAISSMDERMSRVRKAIVPSPSTSAGTIMCETVPQPPTGKSVKPKAALRLTTPSWPSPANTKPGTDMPRITSSMMTMSGRRLR